MEKLTLDGKKIVIRKLAASDLKKTKKHLDFLDSLLNEELKITTNKRLSLKEEREYLKNILKKQKQGKCVYLVAEYDGKFVSHVEASLMGGKQSHIAVLGFAHVDGFRGIGLGSVMGKTLSLLGGWTKAKTSNNPSGYFCGQ